MLGRVPGPRPLPLLHLLGDVLVPMYFIIGIWGGANRIYATIKFFLYTLVGSLLMLVAILATAFTYQGRPAPGIAFNIGRMLARRLRPHPPVLGLPRLLPGLRHQGAHVAVPHVAAGRARRGAHGRLGDPGGRAAEAGRLRLHPLRPAALPGGRGRPRAAGRSRSSIIGIIYGAIVAIGQPDLKKLVAYSSVSHMGFVTLGIFVFQEQGCRARSSR